MGRRPGYRNVVALGLVSFFTDVSTDMILGVLPAFVVVELRATRAALGVMEGLAEFLNYAFRLVSGALSDRLGRRKPIIFLGYLMSTLAKPLFAFTASWPQAVAVRALDRLGKGVRTAPRDALISLSVGEERAGRAFGLHRTLDQLGAVVGPLAAAALVPLVGTRGVFLASFVPGVLALLVLALLVVDVRGAVQTWRPGDLGALLKGRFLVVTLAIALFNLGAYNFSFILVRASELGIPTALLPLIYMLINIIYTGTSYPSGLLADRVGAERALALGLVIFSITSVMFTQPWTGAYYILPLALAFGVYSGIYETLMRAVVSKYAPEELRGTAYGIYYLIVGVAFLTGMTLVGFLWDSLGRGVAFTYSAAMALASAIILLVLSRGQKGA